MNVIGFAGYSGAGKTTLIEQLIALLCAQGQTVSVVKHAHHRFDIDHPGKDSHRHRQAGAYEVLLASDQRLALQRQYPEPREPHLPSLLAQLDPCVDWVLVEGFKDAALPKVEVWRPAAAGQPSPPLLCVQDPWCLALATVAGADPGPGVPAALPRIDLDQPAAVLHWLQTQAQTQRFSSPFLPRPSEA